MSEDELLAIALGHPAPLRPAAGEAVRAPRPVRPLRLGAAVSCRATATTPTCATRAGADPGRGLRRPGLGLLPELLRRAAGAGALHHRRHARRARRARTSRRWRRAIAEAARTWDDRFEAAAARRAARRTRSPAILAPLGATAFPRRLPRPLRRRPRRWPTSAVIERHRRRASRSRVRAYRAAERHRRCSSASSSTARARRRRSPTSCRSSSNMGLKALAEDGFPVRAPASQPDRSGCTSSRSRTRAASTWCFDDVKAAVRGRLRRRLDRPHRERRLQPPGAGARRSPGARRPWSAPSPATASSPASTPARRCRRRRWPPIPASRG